MTTDQCLEIELKHIRPSFHKMNGYPHWVIARVFNKIKEKPLNQHNFGQKPIEDDKKSPFPYSTT